MCNSYIIGSHCKLQSKIIMDPCGIAEKQWETGHRREVIDIQGKTVTEKTKILSYAPIQKKVKPVTENASGGKKE